MYWSKLAIVLLAGRTDNSTSFLFASLMQPASLLRLTSKARYPEMQPQLFPIGQFTSVLNNGKYENLIVQTISLRFVSSQVCFR